LSLRLPGELRLRFDDRTFLASLFQPPPRLTRFDLHAVVTPKQASLQRIAGAPPEYGSSPWPFGRLGGPGQAVNEQSQADK
jgi:hypothetical protein